MPVVGLVSVTYCHKYLTIELEVKLTKFLNHTYMIVLTNYNTCLVWRLKKDWIYILNVKWNLLRIVLVWMWIMIHVCYAKPIIYLFV